MGRSPQDFVPLKFSSEQPRDQGSVMFNVLLLGLAGLFMYQVYKGKTGGSAGQAGKKSSGSEQGKGNMFGRGGGMQDMFNVGKSNAVEYGGDKKIKTKFRHVAGMDNAK